MSYALHLLVLVGIFGILTQALNLTTGLLGWVSICQAAFFGIGAYSTATLIRIQGIDGGFILLLASTVGLAVGAIASIFLFRLRGDYFSLASFAFQMIVFSVFVNARDITGGPVGIAGIGPLQILGVELTTGRLIGILVLINIAMIWSTKRLCTSPAGRVFAAIRQDDIGLVVIGANPQRYRIFLFSMGATAAAFAGGLYACYMGFINPSPFSVDESISILACVVLGGSGSALGPVVGTAVFVLFPEALRFAGFPSGYAANMRQILFGLALVLLMRFKPEGLMGTTRIGYRGQSDA